MISSTLTVHQMGVGIVAPASVNGCGLVFRSLYAPLPGLRGLGDDPMAEMTFDEALVKLRGCAEAGLIMAGRDPREAEEAEAVIRRPLNHKPEGTQALAMHITVLGGTYLRLFMPLEGVPLWPVGESRRVAIVEAE